MLGLMDFSWVYLLLASNSLPNSYIIIITSFELRKPLKDQINASPRSILAPKYLQNTKPPTLQLESNTSYKPQLSGPIGWSYSGYADTGSFVIPFQAHLINAPSLGRLSQHDMLGRRGSLTMVWKDPLHRLQQARALGPPDPFRIPHPRLSSSRCRRA